MKCPKCGYNSFEFYDNCKKCSSDLSGFKQTYSIAAMVLPLEAKEKMAVENRSSENGTDQISTSTETHDDIFSFDLPDVSSPSPLRNNDDPFNFDEPSPEETQPGGTKNELDEFADLLESTSQAEESPFAVPDAATTSAPAAVPDSSSGSGEFDLESFSWDDTPVSTAETAASDSSETADDFDSLFGDTKENSSK